MLLLLLPLVMAAEPGIDYTPGPGVDYSLTPVPASRVSTPAPVYYSPPVVYRPAVVYISPPPVGYYCTPAGVCYPRRR